MHQHTGPIPHDKLFMDKALIVNEIPNNSRNCRIVHDDLHPDISPGLCMGINDMARSLLVDTCMFSLFVYTPCVRENVMI